MFQKITTSIIAVLLLTVPLLADEFAIDKATSTITFEVRHFATTAGGTFHDFDGVVHTDAATPSKSKVTFRILSVSLDTDNPKRDNHMRAEDFFWVEKHPEITFVSTSIKPTDFKDVYQVTGDLVLRGVTKRIDFPVTHLGTSKDADGTDRARFEASITVNRKDYGLNWNKALDQGGFVLGDDVTVKFAIEATRKM